MFRGYMTLNGVEVANTSRVAANLEQETPTDDGVFGEEFAVDCTPEIIYDPEHDVGPFYVPPDTCHEVRELLYSVPDGSRQWSSLLYEFGLCWGPISICVGTELEKCGVINLFFDDSWSELPEFLGDDLYRPEVSPWYSSRIPESAEFAGVWLMDVQGLDTTPVERNITEMVGDGAAAGPHRDAARQVTFDALLVACTNAGVEFGLRWLTCLLRDTTDTTDNILTFLAAHPGYSGVIPETLVRQLRQVVLTKAPEVTQRQGGKGKQAVSNLYRVSWEMTALRPHVYRPAFTLTVDWTHEEYKRINWIHSLDCHLPETCLDVPVLTSATCPPELAEVAPTPPPSCGGCMPICEIYQHTWFVPIHEQPYHCRETVVSYEIRNFSEHPLTLQAFWRVCGADIRCHNTSWPLQIAGLPAASTLFLDGVTGRYHAIHDDRKHYPVGVVGTPTGAPWRPAIIDRADCWEFICLTDVPADFEIVMTFTDREP